MFYFSDFLAVSLLQNQCPPDLGFAFCSPVASLPPEHSLAHRRGTMVFLELNVCYTAQRKKENPTS